ncbi:MAG: hypothetical protein DRZ82_03815 [Thermoprotei archaeon]|nr:MAG: hypothetical protein DRZ82_03815 [Thermoprotei archaeon]
MRLALSERTEGVENASLSSIIEKVLSYILDKNIKVIKPERNLQGIVYPEIDNLLVSLGVTMPSYIVLEALREKGLLEKKVIDRAITCPNCGSFDVITRYHCPNCDSFNLEKTHLVTHVSCGYTDAYINFKKNSKLFCPSCGKEISENELIKREEFSEFFLCRNCNTRITEPEVKHECLSCHTVFTPLEASYIEVSEYYVKEEEVMKYKRKLIISTLASELERQGLRRESNALKGESGITHDFDLVVSQGNRKIVFVWSQDKKGEELVRDMFMTFAKAVDIKNADVVYVVPEENSKNLPKLERSNWFLLVYKNLDDLKKKLTKLLKSSH